MTRRSLSIRPLVRAAALGGAVLVAQGAIPAYPLDGGTSRIATVNGWKAFEVITAGDDPAGDGFNYAIPGAFDGAGARLVDPTRLRVLVNHETDDASISEVDLDRVSLRAAIDSMIAIGTTGAIQFVRSTRQAYGRVSTDGGATFTPTADASTTSFFLFCSGQTYSPHTFGPDRGFVDPLYIAGEELASGRLFALDSVARDLYQLSGTIGSAPGGIGGMSFDSWENAALVDTGETQHVALLLSPDGGSASVKLYIGLKGRDASGGPSNDLLARNGLAYGSWYYLAGELPATVGALNSGTFTTDDASALSSTKLEDIDTSPREPTQVVLGDQNSGLFVFDLDLVFSTTFQSAASSFTVTKIAPHAGGSGSFDSPDNVEWTDSTTLGTVAHPRGLLFVNEDSSNGEIWQMEPDGSGQVRIGNTTVGAESTGIFDLSEWVGYAAGSVLITNNQGNPSSLTVLISPVAETIAGAGRVSGLRLAKPTPSRLQLDWLPSCSLDDDDYAIYAGQLGAFTSHALERCTTGGLTTASLAMPNADQYYLVVPIDGVQEGSYGTDSHGVERSAGTAACHPRVIEAPCH